MKDFTSYHIISAICAEKQLVTKPTPGSGAERTTFKIVHVDHHHISFCGVAWGPIVQFLPWWSSGSDMIEFDLTDPNSIDQIRSFFEVKSLLRFCKLDLDYFNQLEKQ